MNYKVNAKPVWKTSKDIPENTIITAVVKMYSPRKNNPLSIYTGHVIGDAFYTSSFFEGRYNHTALKASHIERYLVLEEPVVEERFKDTSNIPKEFPKTSQSKDTPRSDNSTLFDLAGKGFKDKSTMTFEDYCKQQSKRKPYSLEVSDKEEPTIEDLMLLMGVLTSLAEEEETKPQPKKDLSWKLI